MSKRRGYTKLVLPDGKEIPLLFDMRALAAAEQGMGKSTIALMKSGDIGISEMAQLIAAGASSARPTKRMSVNKAYAVLDQVTYVKAVAVVATAVADVFATVEETSDVGEDATDEEDDDDDAEDDENLE